MEKCEFCGVLLTAETSFCGNCGHIPQKASSQATRISNAPELQIAGADAQATSQNPGTPPDLDDATLLSNGSTFQRYNADGPILQNEIDAPVLGPGENTSLEDLPTMLLPSIENQNDEEEDKRRRAALLGLAIPLLGALAEPPAGHVPSISGTPQLGQLPSLPGTPQLGQSAMGPGFAASGTPTLAPGPGIPQSAPYSPGSGSPPPSLPGSSSPGSPSGSPSSGSSGPSSGSSPGCLMTIIIVVTALVVILAGIITLGLTAWAPNLTLSGTSTVSPGSTMTLHGISFLPNSSVDLTLDNATAIYYLQKSGPAQLANTSLQGAANVNQLLQFPAQGKHTLTVQGNGSFVISVLVDPSWHAGPHTIHASETFTRRQASLNFTIIGVATTATLTATPSPTDMSTATPTATPSPINTPLPTPTPVVVIPTPTPTPTRVVPTPTSTPTPTPSPTPTPPPARLSVSPVRINGNTSCSVVSPNFSCQVTLTNNSQLASLLWSVSFSNYSIPPEARPGSDTIRAGSSETITFLIPLRDQNDTITLTFTGPANSATVTWYYQVIIQ